MKEHVLNHEEKWGLTDAGTQVLDISYECEACGSGVIGTINPKAVSADLTLTTIRSRMRDHLVVEFRRKFPKDCDEAKDQNVCREIHDS